ncbi:MAG: hypothetical protein R2875_13895 [Desulfobacterales bacterium]
MGKHDNVSQREQRQGDGRWATVARRIFGPEYFRYMYHGIRLFSPEKGDLAFWFASMLIFQDKVSTKHKSGKFNFKNNQWAPV